MMSWTRRRDQRGAVAMLMALCFSSFILVIGGLVIDIGNQRVARRDMQAVADLVALDMSRLLDGTTTAGTLTSSSAWTGALSRSVARNRNGVTAPNVTAQVGSVDASGVFTQASSGQVPSAVKVTAARSVGFAFGTGPSSGGVSRSAIASATSTACFKLGSFAAKVSSSNSTLLANMLNGALGVNVSAISYQGLAGGSIGLGALAAQLGVGTVNQLAGTSVTLRQLYLASAAVLTANGDVARAAVLNTLATSVSNNTSFALSGLLNMSTGSGAAATATVDALDLVSGSAFLINGTNFLSIPSLGTTIGLSGTNLTSKVKLIEAAQEACGKAGTTVSTSQADVTVTGQLASIPASNTIGLTGVAVTASAADTNLAIHLASATGKLTRVVCGSGTTASPQGMDVLVTSQLATIDSLSQTLALNGSITDTSLLGSLLGGLLGGIVSVQVTGQAKISMQTGQGALSQTVQVRYPNNPTSWANPVSSGSGSLGLTTVGATVTWPTPLTLTAKNLLGLNVTLSAGQITSLTNNIVSNLTSGIVAPLVALINTNLVAPLSSLLGLTLGGADVYGMATPSCNTPALSG